MGKVAAERRLADNEASAKLTNLRVSPSKLGLVAGLIRNRSAHDALIQLTFSKKAVSREVKKLLESAIANAENNHDLDVDRLYVSDVKVGKGIVMKRFRARARGRAAKILKPFSNISITVRERAEEE